MANTTVANNEPDSGSGGPNDAIPDTGTESGPQDEDIEMNEAEQVTGSNYDSSEGSHRCEQCDFEGSSKASLSAHVNKAHGSRENEADMENENNNPPPDRLHR